MHNCVTADVLGVLLHLISDSVLETKPGAPSLLALLTLWHKRAASIGKGWGF